LLVARNRGTDRQQVGQRSKDAMHLPAVFVFLAIASVVVFREFFRHDLSEDAAGILALLWTREEPMNVSEIVQREGIGAERVAAALVYMDDLGLVRHDKDSDTWAAVAGTESNGD
jgi:hypothetical protein